MLTGLANLLMALIGLLVGLAALYSDELKQHLRLRTLIVAALGMVTFYSFVAGLIALAQPTAPNSSSQSNANSDERSLLATITAQSKLISTLEATKRAEIDTTSVAQVAVTVVPVTQVAVTVVPVTQVAVTVVPVTQVAVTVVPVTQVAVTVVPVTQVAIIPMPLPTLTPNPEIIFSDTFDDNNNGWAIGGSTRLSQGKLVVTAHDSQPPEWLIVPNVKVEDNFYVQAELTYITGHFCFSQMGFALGERNSSNHRFLVSRPCGGENGIIYYDNNTTMINTNYPNIEVLGENVSHVMGLECKDGLYTLYIDGKSTDQYPINRYGNDIGIMFWRVDSSITSEDSTFSIDNVVVRKSR